MLRSGGNAVDAFVAAALVDDVVLPGVTSLAGLAGALVYESKTHALTYVHGGFADPIAPSRRWQPEATAMGAQVLVPGAPHAYAELARRFGTKPLRALVEPAAKLASDGFPADANYAASIEANAQKLRSSEYGRAAFFHDGKPIAEGSTVVLADFGRSLRSFGNDPAWFSRGPWVKEAVALVRAKGGQLRAGDFASYPLQVAPPMHLRFGEADIYAGGWGGATLLSSLGALQILRGSAPRRATTRQCRAHRRRARADPAHPARGIEPGDSERSRPVEARRRSRPDGRRGRNDDRRASAPARVDDQPVEGRNSLVVRGGDRRRRERRRRHAHHRDEQLGRGALRRRHPAHDIRRHQRRRGALRVRAHPPRSSQRFDRPRPRRAASRAGACTASGSIRPMYS